jgi:hypothetical protein
MTDFVKQKDHFTFAKNIIANLFIRKLFSRYGRVKYICDNICGCASLKRPPAEGTEVFSHRKYYYRERAYDGNENLPIIVNNVKPISNKNNRYNYFF